MTDVTKCIYLATLSIKMLIYKAGQNNIVVSCNPTDPRLKPPTQKYFWPFSSKTVKKAYWSDTLWNQNLLYL